MSWAAGRVSLAPLANRRIGALIINRNYAGTFGRECGPCAKPILMDPQCKVAVVTGGATGIGYGIANQLLCANAYRVVLAGPDPCVGQASAKKLCEAHGKNKACFLPLNVCCPKQFEGVLCEVIAKFGQIDILVNNAGILDEKKWELEIDVNLKGVVHGTLLAIPKMKGQKSGGVVVNISAEKALAGCSAAPVFAASKAGVNIFSKGIGGSVKDVRIAALAPGPTDTPMLKDLASKTMFPPSGDVGAKQRPDAVGKAVVYLVQYAESGSIWLAEDAQLYLANWPHKTSYFEKITTL